MVFRWCISGTLLMFALIARADVMPEACPVYRSEENALIDLLGAESGKLVLPQQASQVIIHYGESLDIASLRFLLNDKDITELLQGNAGAGVPGGVVPVSLPLDMGDNVLRVSGYVQGDIRDEQWRHCKLPPLRWQKLSIIREPIKLGVTAEGRKLTPNEARALTGKKKISEGEF